MIIGIQHLQCCMRSSFDYHRRDCGYWGLTPPASFILICLTKIKRCVLRVATSERGENKHSDFCMTKDENKRDPNNMFSLTKTDELEFL